MTPADLRTSTGDIITLARHIGGGGEGDVFELASNTGLVAKIYKRPISEEKVQKLTLMAQIARAHPTLLAVCAWPVDTLHPATRSVGSNIASGLLMPKVSGRKEIHHLTSPSTRKKDFPDKGWAFQIHVSKNLAAALSEIHRAGVVVGDINEKGFLVGADGTLRVIDCDSFQISNNGHLFKCEVGVPDYTPPELQNLPGGFASIVRSVNHDAFGLAIVIFKLLFQGRHPFMGRFSGSGEPDLQRFISEYRFAYSRNASLKQIGPPPYSLGLGALTTRLAELFERSFSDTSARGPRPLPTEWYDSLGDLAKNLRTCPSNDGHQFFKGLSECPWCLIENASGVTLFLGQISVRGTGWSLNVSYFAAAIAKLPELAVESLVCAVERLSGQPVPEHVKVAVRRAKKIQIGLTIAAMLVGGTGTFYMVETPFPPIAIAALIAAAGLMYRGTVKELKAVIAKRNQAIEQARTEWARVQTDWAGLGIAGYEEARTKLNAELKQYAALDAERSQGLVQLEKKKRDLQLLDYLDDFSIRSAGIKGIGAARTATLASFGINTAADVNRVSLEGVRGHGFGAGSGLVTALVAWRLDKESHFRFDASKPVDPREKASLMQRLHGKRQALEQSMNRGIASLTKQAKAIQERRASLLQTAEEVSRKLAQAEADVVTASSYRGG